jgi:UDP-3-O-[3-hydroxymyristoyl] glucosamine N-acyltransferase
MKSNEAVLTVSDVAELVGGSVVGDGSVAVMGIGPVDEVESGGMAFLAAKRYAKYVPASEATSYLVAAKLESYVPDGVPGVVVDDAHPALRTVLGHFHPPVTWGADVHPTAVIGIGVHVGEAVSIGPYVVLEDGASVGDRTRIGAHCVIGSDTRVGEDCVFYPHVVIYDDCVVGDRVMLHSGVRVGSDGFGFTFANGAHLKMPQVGRAVIEDDVEIGANSAIDRGSMGDTVIGRGSKLDNLVHMAHNVKVGALSLFAALVGVAGSTRIGEGVFMGGQVGVSNHLEIGDGARLAIATKLMRDVPAGETMSGHPARPHREQLRRQAHLGRLSKLVDRITALEEAVAGEDAADEPSPER